MTAPTDVTAYLKDEFKEHLTDRQWEVLEAIKAHGSQRAAAAALGVHPSAVDYRVQAVRKKLARIGHAPGHFNHGTAPGYSMGKVTVQRGPGGDVERVWERQHPDAASFEGIKAAVMGLAEANLPRLAPLAAPANVFDDLLNLYIFTDYHLGARAWQKEGGADWDLKIAERVIIDAFRHMVSSAPAAKVGFIANLGDFKHFDGLLPVTPTSRHVLDSAGHFSQIVEASIRIMMALIDMALQRHERVVVLAAEGNHDIAGSVWMRAFLGVLYRDEPRVEIVQSEIPFYAYRWGQTMLAFHHGHVAKKETLPGRFADLFSEMWGQTKKRYAHTGHYHHEVALAEIHGMKVTQHPTLAPNDSHSARGGYSQSWRQTSVQTYSARFGKAGELVVTPEMLAA